MNAKNKKIIKICCWVVGIIILVPIVLVASLPLWLGPIFRPTLNSVAPKVTKTDFQVDKLYLNPYTCNFELGGVHIGNPEGFSETNAVLLGYLNVDVVTASLAKNVIVVENVEISDLYITKIYNSEGKGNLDMIVENVAGAEDKVKKARVEQLKREAEAERRAGMTEEEIKAEEEKAKINKKIIINRLVFKNVSGKIALSRFVTIPFKVPVDIVLTDIGKDSGGYDLDHLCSAVAKEFWASVLNQVGDVGGAIGDGAGKTLDALKDAGKSLTDIFKTDTNK